MARKEKPIVNTSEPHVTQDSYEKYKVPAEKLKAGDTSKCKAVQLDSRTTIFIKPKNIERQNEVVERYKNTHHDITSDFKAI